ncbi:TetM/TetW/TetO/TetS family tetracycline resistance ribosomal protection protein [Streptomyces sp. KM273126]|uniref:elongation factor G n=1 Tax=Streptomyces sp. KM273126 TaxID=2545247 RepID=UPI0015EB4580|nr:TetM/TetW/TetO/TetS family tetracycline resistance ribosomal protection protein [Streptomyces sp. KM273126]MBA2810961.1 TetM/TetW/TetO/TetS family tetracycline resistance ribosomal protection protein [Streptomyces sp. KM273126]
MQMLNLGILAHIDAGKTSLTERLLHAVGVIDEIGSVDDGSTQTDSLALEQQRGITIKSAVVSFEIDDVTVNLIDTPGHPDFIAEVERVLGVLDGAVLVVSAVEGVQAQTRVLMRTLQRLRIPTLIFVNKIDRRGARPEEVLQNISARLTRAIVPMGEVDEAGSRVARFTPYDGHPPRLLELLAEHDDGLLAAYVDDEAAVPHDRLRTELAAQTGRALVHPVFFGSAVTGAGIGELIAGVRQLLPCAEGDADGPLSGTVFKVERGVAGEKIAYVRMFSGILRTRDRLTFRDGEPESKVTAIDVFERGSAVRAAAVAAGRIARLRGLADVRIGDAVGVPRKGADEHHFAPPTLETVVVPVRSRDKGALHTALTQLAEQDPLINLRHDGIRQEISVSLYGEVQKEVIQATLADAFGLDVTFRETTPLCVERLTGTGAAVEFNKKDGNPFLATVGLRVDPAPVGSGVEFRLEVELGSMPYAFFKAVEDTVREVLTQGIHGWQIPDCTVTMTHSGYSPRQSHAHQRFDKSMSSTGADFRGVTPLVLTAALLRAGTRVHEPLHRFRLDVPADTLGAILPVLAKLRAVPRSTNTRGPVTVLEGWVPAAQVHRLEQRLPGLTRGEGELESVFDHYAPVAPGAVPERARTDHNPLDRREYLLNLSRRVVT